MMKSRKLVDREAELSTLEEMYAQDGFRFIVLTGRRRIGKSRLMKEFVEGKDHIRVQFEKRNVGSNLTRLNEGIAHHGDIPIPSFSSFTNAFRFLKKKENLIIVLDEFSYVIKHSDVLAEFQTIVDEVLKDSNIMLIVAGSSFSIMKRGLLEYSSPLYGRADMLINLQPLTFDHLFQWYPDIDVEDLVRIHSSCGGVPRYLEYLDMQRAKNDKASRKTGITPYLKRSFFDPNAFLFREAREMLEEEFNEPETYYSILEAVSFGHTRVVNIANHAYLEAKNSAKYLKILVDLGILKREFPFGSNRKRGVYAFRDPYFAFWFRFVAKYFEDIESGHPEEALWHFDRDFGTYLGRHFEQIATSMIPKLLPFSPIATGRWWHKDIEIDLVARGDDAIGFIEVKWKALSGNEASDILEQLRDKSRHFHHNKDTVLFGLLAKRVEGKEELRSKDIVVWDVDDITRVITGNAI